MKTGKGVVFAAALVLALGINSQARGEAFFVDAADDAGASSEIVPLAVSEVDFVVTYGAGWNLVSIPVMRADMSIGTMFGGDAVSAFKFDAGYAQVDSLSPCEGYWLNLTQGDQFTIRGEPSMTCSTTRNAGWSLMGAPVGGTPLDQVVQDPVGNIVSVFGFSGGYVQVQGSNPVAEGQGYWVNLTQSGTITLNGTTGAGKLATDLRREVPVTGSKLVALSGDMSQTLELGAAAETIVAMPPVPPSGALDARVEVAGIGTQHVPASTQPLDYRMSVQGADVTLQWEIESVDANRWQLVVDGVAQSLEGTGSLALSESADVWLRYLPATPEQFALHSNYPNPFNPSTTIRYELAEMSQVQLTVYDVLGQQIRDLVELQQPAGTYSVVWDGMNNHGQQVANGVYFYEIQAGDFRAIRKMTLSK